MDCDQLLPLDLGLLQAHRERQVEARREECRRLHLTVGRHYTLSSTFCLVSLPNLHFPTFRRFK